MQINVAAVGERTGATRSAQISIAAIWMWVKTLLQWDASVTGLEAQVFAVANLEADVNLSRGTLDAALDVLHERTVKWLTFFKLQHRNDPARAQALRLLTASGGSRQSILDEANAFEAEWRSIDAAWLPEPTQTLASFQTYRESCITLLHTYKNAKSDWRTGVGNLYEYAATLHDENVAWYAAATVMFPVGTAEGDMIRGTIPTTTDVTPFPGQAEIALNESPGPGSNSMTLFAPHASKYDLFRKGPGETEFTKVGADIDEGLHVETGLTPGDYQYKLIGKNSRGSGPESEIIGVTVL